MHPIVKKSGQKILGEKVIVGDYIYIFLLVQQNDAVLVVLFKRLSQT